MDPKEVLQFQPPHNVNEKENQFLLTLAVREKDLHRLAQQMLGSSYFTGKTHGFTKWVSSLGTTLGTAPNPTSQSQATM